MLVFGHRGAAGEAPENTIAGFRHASDRGASYVELDVRLSKDQQLVVVHDDKVNRTTSSKGRVSSFTAAELKKMDARRDSPPWPKKSFTGISTLDEVMKNTPGIKGYNIEVKSSGKNNVQLICELLADRLDSKQNIKGVFVTSSDLYCHEVLMNIAPHIDRGYVSVRPNPFPILEKYQCRYLSALWGTCNTMTVRHAHSMDMHVTAWTVNDASAIQSLYKMKVDSVITDYPSMAVPLIAKLSKK